MAGRSQAAAVQNYIQPIRRALSTITDSVIQVSGYHAASNPHVLTFGADPISLRPKGKVTLTVEQLYEIVRAKGDRGPWKVHTLSYAYHLSEGESALVQYHWHPQTSHIDFPHLHHPSTPRAHFPTRRIALEDVIRLAIREYGVEPIKKTWKRILRETQAPFEKYRTWG